MKIIRFALILAYLICFCCSRRPQLLFKQAPSGDQDVLRIIPRVWRLRSKPNQAAIALASLLFALGPTEYVGVSRPRVVDHARLTNSEGIRMSSDVPQVPLVSGFDIQSYFTQESPEETKDFIMQQTMVRVKDPKVSLDFYTKVLGFNLVMYRDFPQWGFSVYFVAYCDKRLIPSDLAEQWKFCMRSPGCVELTWNYGSEKEEAAKIYNTGNSDATGSTNGEKVQGGFGHLGITVPDVYEACERFKRLGAEFHKSPNGGGMKGLAFVKDPDGYLIEVLPQGDMITKAVDCEGVALDGGDGYRDNSK